MIVVVTVNGGRLFSIRHCESLIHNLQVEVLAATPVDHAKQMYLWVRGSRLCPQNLLQSMPC